MATPRCGLLVFLLVTVTSAMASSQEKSAGRNNVLLPGLADSEPLFEAVLFCFDKAAFSTQENGGQP